MLLTLSAAIAVLIVALMILAIIGRYSLTGAITDNDRFAHVIADFHADLVAYANSSGGDEQAFQRLTMKSTAVEGALGWDNFVNGVRIGMYMLNNAQLLPLAIHEMRREYTGVSRWREPGAEIADAVQTVLFRHLGCREERNLMLREQAGSVSSCVATGWATFTALPISVLSAFGLLTARRASVARQSLMFRLWNFLVALAAIVGPALAYLADREKIDAAVRALFP